MYLYGQPLTLLYPAIRTTVGRTQFFSSILSLVSFNTGVKHLSTFGDWLTIGLCNAEVIPYLCDRPSNPLSLSVRLIESSHQTHITVLFCAFIPLPIRKNNAGHTIERFIFFSIFRNMFPDNLIVAAYNGVSTLFNWFIQSRRLSQISRWH